ncbi:von Willebrand factor type A domain-containing protein [Desulfonispora thiosulfatigenes DSM 11270]|uniref:von Willebrand factor type A domain-containing protein n=1 Tax=Desulfonispora thiosulfatigenes DSM 11270 TaxID=656914 RepID=A0A1W1VP58_DESTI|nr:vWA domain-containing protein [Desulfonispora thiosulfatigenes]SMB95020.1 von Willebrand factor type A domain-containing protein [Desulfonispora thiosulfatigenes DSM 11270]
MNKSKRVFLKTIAFTLTCFMLLSSFTPILTSAAEATLGKAPISLLRQVDNKNNAVKKGEEFTIDYKIQPQPIQASQIIPESYLQDKEIVLVMDTSGSMGKDENDKSKNKIIFNNKSEYKIDVMKLVAQNFVSKFKDDNRVKIALVPYSSKAKDVTFDNQNFAEMSNINTLMGEINKLESVGGTNIGDGLRKAYYKFESSEKNTRKYIILMTDGEPTFYSYTSWYLDWFKRVYKYYLGKNSSYYINSHNDSSNGKEYARKVAQDLIKEGQHSINSFMIAFSNDADGTELKNIATSAGGTFIKAVDGNALDEVYQQLADEINSDLPIHGVKFAETIPDSFSIINVSEGLEINGQEVTGNIGSISYKLNDDKSFFEAEPIEFSITLKAKTIGEFPLKVNSFTYKDLDGTNEIKAFSTLIINVYETDPPEIIAVIEDHPTESSKYKLTVSVDEAATIKVLNDTKEIKTFTTKGKEEFSLDFLKNSITKDKDYLTIKATDNSSNVTTETVPLIYLSLESRDYFNPNKQINERPVKINLRTENNSTITSIRANNKEIIKNQYTDQGKYKTPNETMFKDGINTVQVIVTNEHGNMASLSFNPSLDAIAPNLTAKYTDDYSKLQVSVNPEEKIIFTSVEVDLNNDGVITDGSKNQGDQVALNEIFTQPVIEENDTTFTIDLKPEWHGKEIIVKAKDSAGNIGATNAKNISTILDHCLVLLKNNKIQKLDKDKLDIVNNFETKVGVLFSSNLLVPQKMTLILDKENKAKLDLKEVTIYNVSGNMISAPEKIHFTKNGNKYDINIPNREFAPEYLLIYNITPNLSSNEVAEKGVSIINTVELNGQSSTINLNIKKQPQIK